MDTRTKARPPIALTPTERAPLSVTVSRRLRDAIVSGAMSLGMELPSEKDLSRDLGVGRSTVREALRILQAQGLLSGGDTVSTQRPRVSAEQSLQVAATTMENVLRLGQIPLSDLVELRLLVEGAIARKAAARREPVGLDEARAALTAMQRPRVEIGTFRDADLRFHRGLAVAAGNAAFSLVMGVLRGAIAGHLGEALLRVSSPRAAMAKLAQEHEAILAAVEAGRGAEAARLVTSHIRDFYEEGRRS